LAFDENTLAKIPGDVPKFIGNNKFGASFVDAINPRNIMTDQTYSNAQTYYEQFQTGGYDDE
jgi:hypothetical protein